MQLSLLPLAVLGLATSVAAQGWPTQQQQPQQNPWQPPRPYPNLSDQEIADWRYCTHGWLTSIDQKVSGSKPACDLWQCLHTQAGKYQRGGLLTAVSNVLSPVCLATSAVGGVVGGVPVLGSLFGNV